MRKYFDGIIGNENTKRRLGDALSTGSLSHAYIIEGAEGSGRFTLATQIACVLNCKNSADENAPHPCLECNMCRRILSGSAPDVRVTDTDGRAAIGVDSIRLLKEDVYLSPTESEYKVYIIKNSEKMTAQAQNALLKVLEEPPDKVVFFLLTTDSGELLTTIKSRAQTIRMQILDAKTIRNYLKTEYADKIGKMPEEKAEALVSASGGRIGEAIKLLDEKALSSVMLERNDVDRIIGAITEKTDYTSVYDAFSSLPQKRQEFADSLGFLSSALRDLLIAKRGGEEFIYYGDGKKAREIASKISIGRLVRLLDTVSEAIYALQNNANVSLTLSGIITDIYNSIRKK